MQDSKYGAAVSYISSVLSMNTSKENVSSFLQPVKDDLALN
jgi:hypothetical protein